LPKGGTGSKPLIRSRPHGSLPNLFGTIKIEPTFDYKAERAKR